MKSSSRTRRFGDLTRRILETNFVLKNTTFPAPAISQKVTKCCACHEKSQSTFWKDCARQEKSQSTLTKFYASHSIFTTCCACTEKNALYSSLLYSLLASILSGHLFSMGIHSLWASILYGHLFPLGIYSLSIYSLWASILYASILSHFKNFVTRKFLIQTSFDKSHAHWHTWMSFSKKRMNHQ